MHPSKEHNVHAPHATFPMNSLDEDHVIKCSMKTIINKTNAFSIQHGNKPQHVSNNLEHQKTTYILHLQMYKNL